jgi:hypothetical protein
MKAAFGSVSAGGTGIPEFDVTQNGGGPSAFVASQSGGNAGGITLSKFSLNITGKKHGGEHEGVGTGVPPTTEISARSALVCEEPIITKAAMPTPTKKNEHRILRKRGGLKISLSFPMERL